MTVLYFRSVNLELRIDVYCLVILLTLSVKMPKNASNNKQYFHGILSLVWCIMCECLLSKGYNCLSGCIVYVKMNFEIWG